MSHEREHVTLVLRASTYADLLRIVETRIRSERARAAAYRRILDRSNESIALGELRTLQDTRDALRAAIRSEPSDT